MAEKWVVLGVYGSAVEANLARGRLEAEGIRTMLTGGGSVAVFGGVGGLGGLRLQVPESDARQATGVLLEFSGRAATDDADAPDDALWVCPLCGEAVADDTAVCPACQTERPAPTKSTAVTARRPPVVSTDVQERPPAPAGEVTADAPVESAPWAAESDVEAPDFETLVGDDLVRRAFLSALFPALIPYSFWLLVRLGFYSGKISPRMTRRLYWTYAIDGFWFLAFLLGGLRLLGLLMLRRPF